MALCEGRDSVRPRRARMPIGTDTEPPEVDEPQSNRAYARPVEIVLVEVLGHRRAQRRELLGEADQPVELRLVLCGAIVGVIAVLLTAGAVDSGRLQFRVRPRRDPNVSPRRGDRETLDPLDLRSIDDDATAGIDIAKCSFAATAAPPHSPSTLPTRCATRTRSSSSRATRPARNCSRSPSGCLRRT